MGTDGHFYRYHPEQVTWHQARDACKKEGASLAMEKTWTTHNFLRSNYGDKTKYGEMWIGISDEVSGLVGESAFLFAIECVGVYSANE